jgi:hypothetical protein
MRRLLPNALVVLALAGAAVVAPLAAQGRKPKPDTVLTKMQDRELKRPSSNRRAGADTTVSDKLSPEAVAIRKAAVNFAQGRRRDGTVAIGAVEIQGDTAWTTVDHRNQHSRMSRVRVERRGKKWIGVGYAGFAIQ